MILSAIAKSNESEPRLAKLQYISKYVGDLRNLIGYYTGYVSETYHDVEEYYNIIEQDPAIRHALFLLSLMTAGDQWEIETKDKKLKKIMTMLLSNVERFTHARCSMVEKSVLYGLSIQKKYWKRKKIWGVWWEVPSKLVEVDRRRLRIERDLEDRTKTYWTMWCPYVDQYVILDDRREIPDASLAVQDFVWHWFEREEMSPYFKGMGETLYQLAYIKAKVIQYWADLSEHWGRPLMIATIDAARAAIDAASMGGSGVEDVNNIVSNWLDLLENMRARHVAVKPSHDQIEVHEGGSTGQNILQGLIEYIDKKIQLLLLGAELTTIAPSVGSYALGQIHRGATNSIVIYNRKALQETLERQLLYDIYHRNLENFRNLEIEWPGWGEISLKISLEQEEQREQFLQQQAPGMQAAKQQGVL